MERVVPVNIPVDPAIWWYVTRASAIIAWVLLVTSVTWGILLSTRALKPKDSPGWLLDLHRWMSGLSVVFVGLHMFSLWADDFAHFSTSDLFVPFHSKYALIQQLGPWPVALGVICFYFMIAVQFTSLMMKRLPRKLWKSIHYSSYAVVLVVSFHAGWTGTDTRAWAYRVAAIVLVSLTTIALIVRILKPQTTRSLSSRVEQRRPNQKSGDTVTMKVARTYNLAAGIRGVEFAMPDGRALTAWVPGSHITLHMPNGLQRQYSLCGDPAIRESYSIGVLRSGQSRGGSSWIHDVLSEGLTVEISGPHNNFELEPSNEYLFVAGGIGITPIKAMIESLPARRNWKLLYAGRSRSSMAFAQELEDAYPERVIVHADDEQGGIPDLDKFLSEGPAEVYVCGPEPLLAALQSRVPASRLHFERFAAVARDSENIADVPESYEVTLQRSKVSFTVSSDESLVEAINNHSSGLVTSCGEGVCGTCEVRVLTGTPLHLDSVTSDEDKDDIGVMYPCVSRSKSSTLTLDL